MDHTFFLDPVIGPKQEYKNPTTLSKKSMRVEDSGRVIFHLTILPVSIRMVWDEIYTTTIFYFLLDS